MPDIPRLMLDRSHSNLAGLESRPNSGYYSNEAALCAPCDTALFCGPTYSPCGQLSHHISHKSRGGWLCQPPLQVLEKSLERSPGTYYTICGRIALVKGAPSHRSMPIRGPPLCASA